MADTDQEPGLATLQFLSRSPNRVRLLRTLRESPADAATLQRALDIPRTTLRRNLNELESRGWIYADGAVYHPTVPARLVTAATDELRSVANTASRLTAFFDLLDPRVAKAEFEAFDVEELRARVDDVRVVLPTKADPYAPAAHLEQRLSTASSVRGFTPTLEPLAGRREAPVVPEHATLELVISSAARGSDEVEQLVEAVGGGATIHTTDEPLAYGLFLVGGRVALVGVDEYYRPEVVVEFGSGCESVARWAEDTFARVRDAAEPLNLDDALGLPDEEAEEEEDEKQREDDPS